MIIRRHEKICRRIIQRTQGEGGVNNQKVVVLLPLDMSMLELAAGIMYLQITRDVRKQQLAGIT